MNYNVGIYTTLIHRIYINMYVNSNEISETRIMRRLSEQEIHTNCV
jgi:hypothetical protein